MTNEELKKEAEDYRLNKADCRYFSEPYKKKIERAYIAGAEPREKRIAELEAQIEKMKCCCNCKYYSMEFLPYFCIKKQISTHCTELCCKWEIKEK